MESRQTENFIQSQQPCPTHFVRLTQHFGTVGLLLMLVLFSLKLRDKSRSSRKEVLVLTQENVNELRIYSTTVIRQ